MKVITNDFLLCMAKDKEKMESLINCGEESDKLKKIDIERKLKAGRSFIDIHLEKPNFIKLRKAVSKKHANELTKIALTLHYAQEYQSLRTNIVSQIKMCEDFLASDMCLRSIELHFYVFTEYRKLKSIDFGNLVPQALRSFDLILKKTYPKLSVRKRYVELSGLMNSLELYTSKDSPFLTIEMANLEAKRKFEDNDNYNQTGEDIIVDKIKYEIKKK